MVIVGLAFAWVAAADQTPAPQSKAEPTPATAATASSTTDTTAKASDDALAHKIIVYYLHGTRRCPTCKKLEAYSQEAVQTGFVEDLKAGKITWQVLNTDDSPNEHFVKDYQLYTKSLILSRVENGKETKWKNLEKIWELVGDKEAFVKYVQDEVRLMAQEK